MEVDMEQLAKAFVDLVGTLDQHDSLRLRQRIVRLKRSDGEGWAIGELATRALHFRDALGTDWPTVKERYWWGAKCESSSE
jgi:hypothetical protein